MKKIFALSAIALVLMAFAPQTQLIKTALIVTVLDDLGTIQEGATVQLFKTEEDYTQLTNAIGSETTDNKGKVKFRDLEPIDYYIQVEKGKKNNMFGGEKTGQLEGGKYNKVNVIISE